MILFVNSVDTTSACGVISHKQENASLQESKVLHRQALLK